MNCDYLIVGAGIVGAAVAAEIIKRRPTAKIIVIDKAPQAAFHQTGRNSGVVHSGVYYTPGSLKARFCREGLEEIQAFCQQHQIAYEKRGKLLVATTTEEENNRLGNLAIRAEQNSVQAIPLDKNQLHHKEPAISGVAALLIPDTAITNYTGITNALLGIVENHQGKVLFNTPLKHVQSDNAGYKITAGEHTIYAEHIISCAGLASDRISSLLGVEPGIRILPFRGEYFVLPSELNTIVHHLIYPVPDPTLPFLGVHLTPMIDGTITVGPNAVLALAREKYTKFSFDYKDAFSALSYPGLWKMLMKHPKATFNELKGSLFKGVYLQLVQKYCPSIKLSDLCIYRSANRAQAVMSDGTLVDDFLIKRKDGITVILNAPSPAATGSFAIARHIVNEILGK